MSSFPRHQDLCLLRHRLHHRWYSGDTFYSASKQSSLIVPLLASFTFFNYSSVLDFQQYIKVEKPTKVIGFELVDSSSGVVVDLNGGSWEMLLERVEDNITLEKPPKRLRC